MMKPEIPLTVTLTPDEAWAFAYFLRRAGFADYRHLSESRDHAHEAVNAGQKVRDALVDAGVIAR